MQRITWYGLLAVVALVAPIGGQRQAQQPQMPRATVRELATIEGQVWDWVLLPSRRTLIYVLKTPGPTHATESTFAYDIATKRRTLLGTNMMPDAVSPEGDRLAFSRSAEDGTENFVWTVPIDPKTGIATGQAQRVSLRATTSGAKFSPDGKMLVFRAGPRPDGTWDLALVPATGGPDRVVNFPTRVGAYAWSADGKSLHVERYRNPTTAIELVSVEDGRREPLIPRTPFTNDQPVGISPDARVAFMHANPDRFFYRTVSGAEGEISVALPPPYDDGDVLNMNMDSTRFTAMTQVQAQAVRVLDLATGQARDLLPANVQSTGPAWSPDGRRIAVLTGNLSHYDITVVNADGSSPRLYRVPMHLDGWFGQSPDRLVWERPWSPDGQFLAFRAKRAPAGEKAASGPDDQSQLAVLDVNSGRARVLATSSGDIGRFVWRSDAKAIRTLKRAAVPFGSPAGLSIVEIPLNGPERVLRDISAEFPKADGVVFMSDRAVVVSVATDQGPQRFLVPLDGGAARRLLDPVAEPGLRVLGVGTGLVAGNQLLLGQLDAKGELRAGKILSTSGDPTRTLRLPHASSKAIALPDGKQLVSVGKAKANRDSAYTVFLVPLDGSAPRLIGEINPPDEDNVQALLAPSPNGKLLAYASDRRDTTKIFEIDLGPALQAILKR